MNQIQDYITLKEALKKSRAAGRRQRVGLLNASRNTYSRFCKNTGFLHSLNNFLKHNGIDSYMIFFEADNPQNLDSIAEHGIEGYNIPLSAIPELTDIDVFLTTETVEFLNLCDFPSSSRVMLYPHHLNTILAHQPGGVISEYWLTRIMSYDADYILLPASSKLLKSFPEDDWKRFFSDTSPLEARRGNEDLRILPFGYFDLDFGVSTTAQSNAGTLPGITDDDFIILISPLEAHFNYITQEELVELAMRLSAELPDAKIVLRPSPEDHKTEETFLSRSFPENIIIDTSIMLSEFLPYRPDLLICEANANIRLSYPLAYHIPTVEYQKGGSPERIDQHSYGYRTGSIAGIISAIKSIAGDKTLQRNWQEHLQQFSREVVANPAHTQQAFLRLLQDIAEGTEPAECIRICKQSGQLQQQQLPQQRLFETIIENNFQRHNSPYAIIYYGKLIRKGLELYPDSPLLNYFAGKLKSHTAITPELPNGNDPGYYFQQLLTLAPDLFQKIRWEFSELAALLTCRLLGDKEPDQKNVQDIIKKIIPLLGQNQQGRAVLSALLQEYAAEE